jgi:hypothetical protein
MGMNTYGVYSTELDLFLSYKVGPLEMMWVTHATGPFPMKYLKGVASKIGVVTPAGKITAAELEFFRFVGIDQPWEYIVIVEEQERDGEFFYDFETAINMEDLQRECDD